jgi:hypothetical protein
MPDQTPSAPAGGFWSPDHNTNETVWDAVGVIPGIGNIVNGVNAVQDAYGVATADNSAARGQSMRDLAQDAMGAIPLVGNSIGAARLVYDAFAGNDCAQDFADRAMGGQEHQSPEAYQDDHPPTPAAAPVGPVDDGNGGSCTTPENEAPADGGTCDAAGPYADQY